MPLTRSQVCWALITELSSLNTEISVSRLPGPTWSASQLGRERSPRSYGNSASLNHLYLQLLEESGSQRKYKSFSRKPGRTREELKTRYPEFPAWARDGLPWKPLFLCWPRSRFIHKGESGLARRSMRRERQEAGPASRCVAHCALLGIPISPSKAGHASACTLQSSSESDLLAVPQVLANLDYCPPKIPTESINQPRSACPAGCTIVPGLRFICSVSFPCLSSTILPGF